MPDNYYRVKRVKRIFIFFITISVLFLTLYGVLIVTGQPFSGTHSILDNNQITCLKCHYDEYMAMIETEHGRNIVTGLREVGVNQYDSKACLTCHMKRVSWSRFGITDWVVLYQNANKTLYPQKWVAMGHKLVSFPYGYGYPYNWKNETTGPTSWISISLNSTSVGASILANVSFFDYSSNNIDELIFLTESPNGFYYNNITGVYPDYFRIGLLSNFNITAETIVVESDGFRYEVSSIEKITYNITNTNYTMLASLVWDSYNQNWNYSYYPDNWNFHTGQYSNVIRMNEVWNQIREINQTSFPTIGIPIDYLAYNEENAVCSSTQGLCHITQSMIKLSEDDNIDAIIMGEHDPYYQHSMTVSTNPDQTCGTCHASFFTSGPSTHYNDQTCYSSSCHKYHDITIP